MRILRVFVIDLIGTTATNGSVLNGATTMVTAAAITATVASGTIMTIISNTDVIESASALTVTTSGANDQLLWLFEYELTN